MRLLGVGRYGFHIIDVHAGKVCFERFGEESIMKEEKELDPEERAERQAGGRGNKRQREEHQVRRRSILQAASQLVKAEINCHVCVLQERGEVQCAVVVQCSVQ